jgi:hypothetical protein
VLLTTVLSIVCVQCGFVFQFRHFSDWRSSRGARVSIYWAALTEPLFDRAAGSEGAGAWDAVETVPTDSNASFRLIDIG